MSSFAADLLALPFVSSQVYTCLGLRELAAIENTSVSFSHVLKELDNREPWVSAIHTLASRRRLELPLEALNEMQLDELKHMAQRLRRSGFAGPVDGSAKFTSLDELMTVLKVTENKVKKSSPGAAYAHSRTVIGRLHFAAEDLEDALDIEEDDDVAPEEQLMCFSDEMSFWWPSPVVGGAGITLSAAVGCRKGMNVVDLCETSETERKPGFSLKFRLQLVHPNFTKEIVLSGDSITVGGACACKHELLDIADDEVRKILAEPEGVLCVLFVEEIPEQPAKILGSRIKSEVAGPAAFMNALCLSANSCAAAAA